MISTKFINRLDKEQLKMIALLGLEMYGRKEDWYWNQIELLENNPTAFEILEHRGKGGYFSISLYSNDYDYKIDEYESIKSTQRNGVYKGEIAVIELDDYGMNFLRNKKNKTIEMNSVIRDYLAYVFKEEYVDSLHQKLYEDANKEKNRVVKNIPDTERKVEEIKEKVKTIKQS